MVDKSRVSSKLVGCLVLSILCAGAAVIAGRGCGAAASRIDTAVSGLPAGQPARAEPEVNLGAAVAFEGTIVTVINEGSVDWTNVRLRINGGVLDGGYTLEVDRIAARETRAFRAGAFADSKDVRFDVSRIKPRTFGVSADVAGERKHAGFEFK